MLLHFLLRVRVAQPPPTLPLALQTNAPAPAAAAVAAVAVAAVVSAATFFTSTEGLHDSWGLGEVYPSPVYHESGH